MPRITTFPLLPDEAADISAVQSRCMRVLCTLSRLEQDLNGRSPSIAGLLRSDFQGGREGATFVSMKCQSSQERDSWRAEPDEDYRIPNVAFLMIPKCLRICASCASFRSWVAMCSAPSLRAALAVVFEAAGCGPWTAFHHVYIIFSGVLSCAE